MQQHQEEELQVQLLQSTSVFNKVINLNATFDGFNIIYIAGANIVFHNVFQNTKQFIERASSYQILGLAFHKTIEVSIALFTKTTFAGNSRCFVQFYYPGKAPILVQIIQNIEFKDMIFTEKKKVCLLCKDNLRGNTSIIVLSNNRKLKKIQLNQQLSRFLIGQRSIYITSEQKGCWEFNSELQALENLRYESFNVKCLFNIEQSSVIVDNHNIIYVFLGSKQTQRIKLSDYYSGQWGYGVKVGHSLLVSFKGEFTVGHFYMQNGKLLWGGSFQYCQRLRANIICMQGSADEMNLALSVQIFYKDSWSIQHFLFNLAALSSEKKFVSAYTRLVPGGSQSGEVVSMQTVIPSQVFLLSGPSIVNYSYVDHIEKKHKYIIHQSPRLIAVNPLGHQILCTFEGSIKFYQKIQLELVQTWGEPWCCSAAVYTQSGLLLLCIYDEGTHQLILYNPNSFKVLKIYSSLYLKHGLTKLELDQTGIDMILWAGNDLAVHKFKNGQKTSEFRGKKEGYDAFCVEYDNIRKIVLVAFKKGLAMCRKSEEYHLNFTQQKHISISEQISSICVKQSIQTAFLGTSDGKVLFATYPFTINEEVINDNKVFSVQFRSVKIHTCPTSDLLLTNNGKFLFVTSKTQGLAILKIRKTGPMGSNYNPFDISNYNFIETSSKTYLESVQEKLKTLLQKRKTIFNELDQFKKQWECKRNRESKAMNLNQKKKELQAVNLALEEISKMKQEQIQLKQSLAKLQNQADVSEAEGQLKHRKELLMCYQQNNTLKQQWQQVSNRCEKQYSQVQDKCVQNLQEIEEQLNTKFQVFKNNYELMRENLLNFNKRLKIQRKEDSELQLQAVEQAKCRLRQEQQQLLRKNNELKGEITRNKKNLDRFMNRRDFLQNKQRFFKQQLRYCQSQQHQLLQIKQMLSQELGQLQNVTYKKEKRLRKYFLETDVLIKYQIIHDSISKTNNREIGFIQENQQVLRTQINTLQKEILQVSQNRMALNTRIAQQKTANQHTKESLRQLKAKRQYLDLQIRQIERLLATVGSDHQHELQGLYERFFIEKRLQSIIECRKFEDIERQESKQIEVKIKEELESYKNYLVKNTNVFQKLNNKAYQEVHLSNAKYQTQNYTLINQCNTRKEQISKKKRVFQEMVNSFRQTQNYLAQLHNNTLSKSNQSIAPAPLKTIPYIDYERQQQLFKSSIKKQNSQATLTRAKSPGMQVRKMLDIQRLSSPESRTKPARRIQTANIKKKPQESTHEEVTAQQQGAFWVVSKPQTAKRARGAQQQARRLFSRNKSNSKPTTCTSHSKFSLFT